jgi:hypothetical protein
MPVSQLGIECVVEPKNDSAGLPELLRDASHGRKPLSIEELKQIVEDLHASNKQI